MTDLFSATMLLVANYYATTCSFWLFHWCSHLKHSPLFGFHIDGHHKFYPHSNDCVSAKFRSRRGKHNSTIAFVTWMTGQFFVEFASTSVMTFALCLAEGILLVIALGYIHAQFHLDNPTFGRFRWFARARCLHLLHHDLDRNFMVFDHFWDRRFRTFSEVAPSAIFDRQLHVLKVQ